MDPCIRATSFGGPRRIRSFPRSVSAPRVPGSAKRLSASAASRSNLSRNSFAGDFGSGSRRSQNRAMNRSASASVDTPFHSCTSPGVAR